MSLLTVRVTVDVEALFKLRVTPSMTSSIWLLELVTASPLTVKLASNSLTSLMSCVLERVSGVEPSLSVSVLFCIEMALSEPDSSLVTVNR